MLDIFLCTLIKGRDLPFFLKKYSSVDLALIYTISVFRICVLEQRTSVRSNKSNVYENLSVIEEIIIVNIVYL